MAEVLRTIVAPSGAGGNHFRWLLLLDNRFEWNFCVEQTPKMPAGVNFKSNNVNEKIKFLTNVVYNRRRRYFNWLEYEHSFRYSLDSHINFTHTIDDLNNHKVIYFRIDPVVAISNYLKFNFGLNSMHPLTFIDFLKRTDQQVIAERPDALVLNAELLYNPLLDRELYTRAINWFGLEDHYEKAASIHIKWYRAHARAKTELIDTFNTYILGNK